MNNPDPHDRELADLFRAYRESCPDPEPSANFMPRLWQRIEARQSFARDVRWLAQGVVTAAAALSLLLGVFLIRWESPVSFYTDTYLEVLATDQENDGDSVAAIIPVAQDTY